MFHIVFGSHFPLLGPIPGYDSDYVFDNFISPSVRVPMENEMKTMPLNMMRGMTMSLETEPFFLSKCCFNFINDEI